MTAPKRKQVTSETDRRRRRHPRYRADFRIVVSYLDASNYRKVDGHCSDLAEAGIGMLLPTELNHGEVLGLSFSLPGIDVTLQLRAVVRYRRGYHYGCEFLSLTNEQRESLRTYLERLEPLD